MSYYRIFNPTDKEIKEIEKVADSATAFTDSAGTKTDLLVYCMQKHDDNPSSVRKSITWMLRLLVLEERRVAYRRALDSRDDDNTIVFGGRQYSEDDLFDDDWLDNDIQFLTTMACVVETPSWFDDNEKFYDKYNELEEQLNCIRERAADKAVFEMIEILKDCENPNDDYMYGRVHPDNQTPLTDEQYSLD